MPTPTMRNAGVMIPHGYHGPGRMRASRWGSLARMGFPLREWFPFVTQLLLPSSQRRNRSRPGKIFGDCYIVLICEGVLTCPGQNPGGRHGSVFRMDVDWKDFRCLFKSCRLDQHLSRHFGFDVGGCHPAHIVENSQGIFHIPGGRGDPGQLEFQMVRIPVLRNIGIDAFQVLLKIMAGFPRKDCRMLPGVA